MEHAGLRHGRSTADQLTFLTQDVEISFADKKKGGAVFVDLTAAYDLVRRCGHSYKLLRLLSDRHMVRMIIELVNSRSFSPNTGSSEKSRLRHWQNAVQQESVQEPLLFNIYISTLPTPVSKKYA